MTLAKGMEVFNIQVSIPVATMRWYAIRQQIVDLSWKKITKGTATTH